MTSQQKHLTASNKGKLANQIAAYKIIAFNLEFTFCCKFIEFGIIENYKRETFLENKIKIKVLIGFAFFLH